MRIEKGLGARLIVETASRVQKACSRHSLDDISAVKSAKIHGWIGERAQTVWPLAFRCGGTDRLRPSAIALV